MAAALPFIALAGSAIGAVGAIRSGNAANNAAQANASMLRDQAQSTRMQALQREEMQRRHARQVVGQQVAASAESGGGLFGSNLDLLRESAFNAEMDALGIRYEGQTQATNMLNQATMESYAGKQRRTGGYLSAAGSLLNGTAGYISGGGTLPFTPKAPDFQGVGARPY